MVNKTLFAFLSGLFFCAGISAQEKLNYEPRLIGSAPYSDPAFQDYIETSDGYLNPKNAAKVRGDFRDALAPLPASSLKKLAPPPLPAQGPAAPPGGASAAHPDLPLLPPDYYKVTFADDKGPIASFVKPLGRREGASAREYVFVSILPKAKNYAGMLGEITASAGFKFSGEKTLYLKNTRRTLVLGWAPAAKLYEIHRNRGVAAVSVEKRSSGVPLKTRVRFTLKIPYQNRPGAFVGRFIKELGSEKGFVSENIFRLPAASGASKFTAFDVTGSLPIDMVGELSRSPFVVSVELKDPSL